jgi:hypothetical protein
MFTRFRTMPIARSAVLGGHIVASVIVNAVSVILIGLIALLIGYRPTADLTGWLVTVGLLLLALIDFSIIGVAFGIFAKTSEGSSHPAQPRRSRQHDDCPGLAGRDRHRVCRIRHLGVPASRLASVSLTGGSARGR